MYWAARIFYIVAIFKLNAAWSAQITSLLATFSVRVHINHTVRIGRLLLQLAMECMLCRVLSRRQGTVGTPLHLLEHSISYVTHSAHLAPCYESPRRRRESGRDVALVARWTHHCRTAQLLGRFGLLFRWILHSAIPVKLFQSSNLFPENLDSQKNSLFTHSNERSLILSS